MEYIIIIFLILIVFLIIKIQNDSNLIKVLKSENENLKKIEKKYIRLTDRDSRGRFVKNEID